MADRITPICPDCHDTDSVHVREQQLVEVPVHIYVDGGDLFEVQQDGSPTIVDSDQEDGYRCDCGFETDDLADFAGARCQDCQEPTEDPDDTGLCPDCTADREEYGA